MAHLPARPWRSGLWSKITGPRADFLNPADPPSLGAPLGLRGYLEVPGQPPPIQHPHAVLGQDASGSDCCELSSWLLPTPLGFCPGPQRLTRWPALQGCRTLPPGELALTPPPSPEQTLPGAQGPRISGVGASLLPSVRRRSQPLGRAQCPAGRNSSSLRHHSPLNVLKCLRFRHLFNRWWRQGS